ncbi:MAG: fasciclin domain-containing protein [bacterium]|nr:fasciclin domain-containing protein [bacterium]
MKSTFLLFVMAVGVFFGGFAPEAKAQPGPDLVEVAIAVNSGGAFAGQFDTLIAAVLAADPVVLDTLSGRGQFTVFAPTDDAFAALGLTPANVGTTYSRETLTQILLYHVVRGRRDAGDVTTSDRIRSLQGTFFFPNSSATITDALGREANIIVTDVPASNGIIHAIDAVILPFAP